MSKEIISLWWEFCDMDYWDHLETAADDLKTINELVKTYGIDETRQILKAYFE